MNDATPTPTTPAERLAQIHEHVASLFAGMVIPDLVELAMATAISQRVVPDGPPVWLLLEGAPSSGKTSSVDLLKNLSVGPDALTVFAPKVSLGSLTSGYKNKSDKRAPSLLAAFHRRCWCNTEFSTLLTGRPEQVAPVLGVLTAAFDGDFAAAFGNVTEQDSPILTTESRFSVLGCITPAVRQDHTELLSQLGPRFLTYRLMPPTHDEQRHASALTRDPQRAARLKGLRALIHDHVRVALAAQTPVIPGQVDQVLEMLARLIAIGRTPVTGRGPELTVGDTEGDTRVYQQLRALLVSLAHVQGTTTPSPRALRLVRDVALGSFEPRRAEALLAQRTWPVAAVVMAEPGRPKLPMTCRHGLTILQLADAAEWSRETAGRVLRELEALGLYSVAGPELVPSPEGAGKPPTLYEPAPLLAALLNATFETWPPRLVTVMDLFNDHAGAYRGCLSPPDARLEAAMTGRRAEQDGRLRDALRRVRHDLPELDDESIRLLATQEVTGIRFDLWTVELPPAPAALVDPPA